VTSRAHRWVELRGRWPEPPAVAVGSCPSLSQARAREEEGDPEPCPWAPRGSDTAKSTPPGPRSLSGNVFPQIRFRSQKAYSVPSSGLITLSPLGKRILPPCATRRAARDPVVNIFLTDRSLVEKPSQLFARTSDSGESKAYFFVSSSPFCWYHFHHVLTQWK
jgi:hypothetical protein